MQHRIMQLLTIVVVAILALVPLTSGAMLGQAATTQTSTATSSSSADISQVTNTNLMAVSADVSSSSSDSSSSNSSSTTSSSATTSSSTTSTASSSTASSSTSSSTTDTSSSDGTIPASGTIGTVKWTIDSDGALTLSGGTFDYLKTNESPWAAYSTSITSIKITDTITVTTAPNYAYLFANLTALTLVKRIFQRSRVLSRCSTMMLV